MSAATHDPPQGRLTRPKLDAIVAAICARLGVDATDAELIKFTNNAVFRLPRAPVVIRIAGSATMRERVAKVVLMARWLAQHEIPAVRLMPYLEQPLVVDGQLATIWQAVPAIGPPPTGADLGRLLRRLHAIDDAPPNLPAWNLPAALRSRLAEAEGLDAADLAFLVEACDEMEAALAGLSHELPPGVIHGDATVANLIPGPDGPVMCDFDGSSVGPREWDLTPVAVGHFRFANSSANQALLAESYGFDVTRWPGFPVLRRLRELQLVTSVVPVLHSNPGLRQQWQHRLRTFRAGDVSARWELYR